MPVSSDSPSSAVSVLDGSLLLPAPVVSRAAPSRRRRGRGHARGRGRAAAARRGRHGRRTSSSSRPPRPPYDEGGSVQALAELTGLAGDIVALELTSSLRDGLTAIRLAAALVAADGGTALVCAAHKARGEKDAGDGAAASPARRRRRRRDAPARGRPGPKSSATAGGSRVRPTARGRPELRVGRRGAARRARVGPRGAVRRRPDRPRRRHARSARSAARATSSHAAVGVLGAAHALGRLVLGLGRTQVVVAVCGRARRGRRTPSPAPEQTTIAARARAVLAAPRSDAPPEPIDWSQLTPYASGPRSWRERGQDSPARGLALRRLRRLLFPPPDDLSPLRQPRARARAARAGRHRRHRDARSRLSRLALDRDGGRRARRRRQVLRPGRPARHASRSATACGSCRAGCTTAAGPPSTSGSWRRRR